MASLILLGDDQVTVRSRRAALAESSGAGPAHVLSYDLEDPDQRERVLDVISLSSMFAEPRLIEARGAETIDAEYAERLAVALRASQPADTVVIWGTRLAEPAKRALLGVKIETHAASAGTLGQRLRALAAQHDLRLDDPVVTHIEQVTGGDLATAASLVYALTVTGVTRPSIEQVDRFAGPATVRGTAWGVADALAVGDLRTALSLADACEPLAVLSYLGTRLGQVGRTAESPLRTAAEVAGAFGIPNLTSAQRVLDHATRLGPRGVASSWTLLAAADVAVKRSPNPRQALDATLVKLGRLWSHVTPEPLTAARPAPRPLTATP